MVQRKIWIAFLTVLILGVFVSTRIAVLGNSVQEVNHKFIKEKLPFSQLIGELRGAIADKERLLYEYYSFTSTRTVFLTQSSIINSRIEEIVQKIENDKDSLSHSAVLRSQLQELNQLSQELSKTLGESNVDWDLARSILAQVKPKVRQIENTLAILVTANRQAVTALGEDSQLSVITMVRWVIGFAILTLIIAIFVGYYVTEIIKEGIERRRLAMFPERDPNPVLRLNEYGEVLYANPASAELITKLDHSINEISKLLPSSLNTHLKNVSNDQKLNVQFEDGYGNFIFEYSLSYLNDFSEFHLYIKDITSRKQAEEKLAYQAFFDPATGLSNQYRLFDDLNGANLNRNIRTVMMIVADREQEIFESFGAIVTEQWLISIAKRLQSEIAAEEKTLYRFSDNVFVLVSSESNLEKLQLIADQLLNTSKNPLIVDGRELFSTFSIGASITTLGNSNSSLIDSEEQLQQAAAACNRVRRAGGNDFKIFDEDLGESVAKTLKLAADLQHAVERDELILHYQPKVDAISKEIVGMEALVRWKHPERGMVSPIEFIPIAEDTGLIVPIGKWVLNEACRQNVEWQQSGLPPLRVAVNLSARQFRSGNLLDEIDNALKSSGLPTNCLELEITESLVMDDADGVKEVLNKIHQKEIYLSLDDFGTGHSSLSYLKHFPIDCLKIDRAFIKDTPGNTDDVAIAKTIVAMAKALGLKTVAEGVESFEQFDMLKEMGCDQIQGYFFSKPLNAHDFVTYYHENTLLNASKVGKIRSKVTTKIMNP